jgi:hypothetical protein
MAHGGSAGRLDFLEPPTQGSLLTSASVNPRLSFLGLTLMLALSGCSHTDAVEYLPYGAAGPLAPGAEARLALSGSGVQRVDGGPGILYIGSACLARNYVRGALIPALRMLPAAGGSATWELCESVNSYRTQADSAEGFGAAAMAAGGSLLYTICTWPNLKDLGCENSGHVQLWQSDSAWPYSRRRLLVDLYASVLGVPRAPRTTLNNLTEIRWAGSRAFVARGFNVNPTVGDSILGLVIGRIDSAGATLQLLPNTADVQSWSTAQQGRAIIANRGDFAIETISTVSGVADTLVAMPDVPGRSIAAISCRGSICLVVTNDGGRSTFWQLGLNSRQLVQLGVDAGSVTSAALSPVTDAVVLGRTNAYYLLAHVGIKPEIQ